MRLLTLLLVAAMATACRKPSEPATTTLPAADTGTYAFDATFIRDKTSNVVELKDAASSARVLLSADYQGRVMTSTAGDSGASFGWINYNLLASGKKKAQFNAVGGEERFWLGPEGGQYALYFKKGDPFTIDHWQVPAIIDTLPYRVVSQSDTAASFEAGATLENYSGNTFSIGITRTVRLLDRASLARKLKVNIPAQVAAVAYETDNAITNKGQNAWTKKTGLLSIWLLGMMTPTGKTTVIIPFKPLPDARTLITDNYFGSIPPDRLQVHDSVLYFTCDGKLRSKIGLSPVIAKPMAASFDFEKNVLTVIVFPVEKDGAYVNSTWTQQEHPFAGDVVNAYNDGPLNDGTQLGPFYELESSSAARELKPNDVQRYRQTTCHLQGSYTDMRDLAQQLLGIDLNNLKK